MRRPKERLSICGTICMFCQKLKKRSLNEIQTVENSKTIMSEIKNQIYRCLDMFFMAKSSKQRMLSSATVESAANDLMCAMSENPYSSESSRVGDWEWASPISLLWQ